MSRLPLSALVQLKGETVEGIMPPKWKTKILRCLRPEREATEPPHVSETKASPEWMEPLESMADGELLSFSERGNTRPAVHGHLRRPVPVGWEDQTLTRSIGRDLRGRPPPGW